MASTQASSGPTVGSRIESDEGVKGVEAYLARDWDIWSRSLGMAVQPVLAQLADELPALRAALFCTADGLNLCTLGVAEGDVGRLAALTSSMFSVGAAHRQAMTAGGAEGTTVNISTGADHTVLLAVELKGVGHFVLGAYAEDIQLGLLLVKARGVAERIIQKLVIGTG
ncbi:roadblock/LC7 domain-containing protein [Luteipulveratus halotolerans]|uniref:Roadblock/LAMTOR2 domain-containing protein n=1 Tax=Luteipulveratus halotolerans TaxID=1631356 RepID=A0A0L6CKI4_9MICO|nr:hypothetical protein [Luteipulveratus halotolerans]KNX38254.1 hypothetical protein VV01_15655 [Luteipulveratus halotolerans]